MDKTSEETETTSATIYYILGAIVLVLIVVAGFLLRPKNSPSTSATSPIVAANPTPTPGPITKLACEKQYYNPVIGLKQYYISAEGVDIAPAKKVDCEFSVMVSGKKVSAVTVQSPLTNMPQRGGNSFRCSTQAVDLEPNVPTTVGVIIKDDQNATASCSADFIFPSP